jgi:RNA polymerase sigma-70 factor (ECF subfamily)
LPDGGDRTDGQLLESFLARREETAFEALVQRHGPMVLGVCRRVLRNAHDAEDAFQATFLVLFRQAAALTRRATVGNWLYGVAYHTALKARAAAMKRRAKERDVAALPKPEGPAEDLWQNLQPLLDRELQRLPDKYREPIVLCNLEGKTQKVAAQQLGWPEGTVAGRLARARALLAKRLRRYGLMVSAGTLGGALFQASASAGVPARLLASTVQVVMLQVAGQAVTAGLVTAEVAALSKAVLNGMFWAKVKATTAVLLGLGVLGGSVVWLAYQLQAATPEGAWKEAGVPALAPGAQGPRGVAGPKQDAARREAQPLGTGFAVVSGRLGGETDSVPVRMPARKPLPGTVLAGYKGHNQALQEIEPPPLVSFPSPWALSQAPADQGTGAPTLCGCVAQGTGVPTPGASPELPRDFLSGISDPIDSLVGGRNPVPTSGFFLASGFLRICPEAT